MAADDDRPAILFGQAWPSLTAAYALAVHGVEIWVCAPSRFPAAYLRGAGYAAAPDPATDEAGAIDALCRLARGLSERIERCDAIPREISSRSDMVSANLDRRRGEGRIPPDGAS